MRYGNLLHIHIHRRPLLLLLLQEEIHVLLLNIERQSKVLDMERQLLRIV